MKPTLSEFSYGYGLTENLVKGLGPRLTAAPVFPSLKEEGKSGYDLRLNYVDFALFLQFKLSEHMIKKTANEIKSGLMSAPFYRMHLWSRKRSQQHQLLISLTMTGEKVFYAVPAFHNVEKFNEFYLTNTVVDNSVFINPLDIGPLRDDAEHHVAFSVRPKKAYFCSEPQAVQITLGSDLEESIRKYLLDHPAPHTSPAALGERVNEHLLSVLREHSPESSEDIEQLRRIEPLQSAAYLSRVYFGCELYFVSQLS